MACFERICRTTNIVAPLFSSLRFRADFELLERITTSMLTSLSVQAPKGPRMATRHINILAWFNPSGTLLATTDFSKMSDCQIAL